MFGFRLAFVFFAGLSVWAKKTKICCIGGGYVGGTTGCVIAEKCPDCEVHILDTNAERIEEWNGDEPPLHEAGLKEIVKRRRGENLFFTTEKEAVIQDADIVFLCVNTPTKEYGFGEGLAYDLTFTENAVHDILRYSKTNKIIVEKSTVPSKTGDKIRRLLETRENKAIKMEVLSNPEFLAQGEAVANLLNPDRILLGSFRDAGGLAAEQALKEIYLNWIPDEKIITTDIWTSELGKLASNALLAQRVSSINALSELCEKVGGNIDSLAKIVGLDSRIGSAFLKAGLGFGGSCFEKDLRCLVYLCEHHGLEEAARYWRGVLEINTHQKERFGRRIVEEMFSTVSGKKIAILGFAFKKGTGDTRAAPAADVTQILLSEKANVSIYDPVARAEAIYQELGLEPGEADLEISSSIEAAAFGAHALVLCTEWNEIVDADYRRLFEVMAKPAFIFDGRNMVGQKMLKKQGFSVHSIGKAE